MDAQEKKKKEELLKQVAALFMSYGIRSMTMDEVARHLGKSKKTLYKYVKDKKDLVKQALEVQIKENQEKVCSAIVEEGNAIDELIGINIKVSEQLKNIHPSVLFDLKKYYPAAWKVLEDHKQVFIRDQVMNNLKRGLKEGMYRRNLQPEIITELYLAMINMTIDPDFKTNDRLSFEQLLRELVRYHIRAIASEKGMAYLSEKLNNKKQNKKKQ